MNTPSLQYIRGGDSVLDDVDRRVKSEVDRRVKSVNKYNFGAPMLHS